MPSSPSEKSGFSPGLALQSSIRTLLAATVTIGSTLSLLAAEPANAATSCTFGFSGSTCNTGTLLDLGDKRVTLSAAPSAGKGTVNFDNLVDNLFTVTVNFDPQLAPTVTDATFQYDIEIVSGNQYFTGVKIDSTNTGGGSTRVVKSELLGANYFASLTSNNGLPVPSDGISFEPIPGTLTKLRVVDKYSVGGAGRLQNFVNTYRQSEIQVPGPLPVMGAGVAFGFSRRLRRRIKTSGVSAKG